MDDETKKRIEEEERYRAQVRAKLAASQAKPKKKKSSQNVGCGPALLAIGLFVVLAIIIASLFNGGGSNNQASTLHITTPSGTTYDKYDAEANCKRVVKKQLKAPRTAKFSNSNDGHNGPYVVGNSWKWDVLVDAENGFSALIRSEWLCTVSGDTNKVEAVKIR